MSTCSTRSHCISSPMASGKLRGGLNNRPGFFFLHRSAHVRQNPRHDVSKPLHEPSFLRPVTPSTSPFEGPRTWKLRPTAWLVQPRPISRVSLT